MRSDKDKFNLTYEGGRLVENTEKLKVNWEKYKNIIGILFGDINWRVMRNPYQFYIRIEENVNALRDEKIKQLHQKIISNYRANITFQIRDRDIGNFYVNLLKLGNSIEKEIDEIVNNL